MADSAAEEKRECPVAGEKSVAELPTKKECPFSNKTAAETEDVDPRNMVLIQNDLISTSCC